MKKKADKKLRAQAIAATTGLIASVIILLSAFILSEIFLNSVQDRLQPLFDEALLEVENEDYEAMGRTGEQIYAVLKQSESKLELFVNHRDIIELMRLANELKLIGADGDKITYMNSISGIQSWFEYIKKCNGFGIGVVI